VVKTRCPHWVASREGKLAHLVSHLGVWVRQQRRTDCMKPRENGDENFVMVHQRDLDSTIALLGERKLELRDAAVFLVLLNYVNWRSGRAHVSTRFIAERLQVKLPVAVSAITRLRKENLVRRIVDRRTGETYFLINPFLASVGGPSRRGHLWQQFEDTVD